VDITQEQWTPADFRQGEMRKIIGTKAPVLEVSPATPITAGMYWLCSKSFGPAWAESAEWEKSPA
jgi:hypothetical protein